MFRLTAVLLAGLYATMAIWGHPVDSELEVTRADTPTAVPALAAAAGPRSDAHDNSGEGLADVGASEAIEMALAAGEARASDRPAPSAERPAAEGQADLWYVTGSRVNLRDGPSTNAAIVGGVSLGDRAEVLSDPSDAWTRIRTDRGTEAWIYSRFLSETPA